MNIFDLLKKKSQDYFRPTENVRARDVLREMADQVTSGSPLRNGMWTPQELSANNRTQQVYDKASIWDKVSGGYKKNIDQNTRLLTDNYLNKGMNFAGMVGNVGPKANSTDDAMKVLKNKAETPLSNEEKTYKTTINLKDKDDTNYLSRILGEDRVKQLQSGDYTHFRNPDNSIKYWEDTAKVNIVSETPKTVAENLAGKVKDYKLNNDTVFHGTSQDNVNPILSGGFKSGSDLPENAFRSGGHGAVDQKAISFSTDEKQASVFGGVSAKGAVLEAKLKPNAKVVTVDGVDYAEDLNDMIPELRKQGIDAVYLEGEKEVAVINKSAVKPTGKYQNFNAIDKYNPTLSTTPKTKVQVNNYYTDNPANQKYDITPARTYLRNANNSKRNGSASSPSKITGEELNTLTDFQDWVNGKFKLNSNQEMQAITEAERLAQQHGAKSTMSVKELSNEIDKIFNRIKRKK